MSDNEHDQGIPKAPLEPAFFDPSEAIRKARPTFFAWLGPDDAIEAERIAAEEDAESAAEDKEDDTRQ